MSGSRSLRLNSLLSHDGTWWVARCVEVEVTSQGATIEEALANLREAVELYFEDEPVPSVSDTMVAPIEVNLPA